MRQIENEKKNIRAADKLREDDKMQTDEVLTKTDHQS